MNTVGIIPARYQSTRFPGKPLAKICGKPMIEWVYKRAANCRRFSSLIVATDDERIFETVSSFGGSCVLTPKDIPSGTDRIALAAKNLDCDIIINIQGDEPLIEPLPLEALIDLFQQDNELKMATLITPLTIEEELKNPNIVKVVIDKENFCLYFSRSPVPYLREIKFNEFSFYKHIGIYGYRKDYLLKFASTPPQKLEKAESLEQLRALETGVKIKAEKVEKWRGISVDTPEDIKKAEDEIKKGGIIPP